MDPTLALLNHQPHFKFRPLLDMRRCFRLLDLQPDSGEKPIRSYLRHVNSVANCPDYYALSYEWGLPTEHEWIHVDATDYRTRRNLHTFLLQLRHPRVKRTLFIDAICIDQENMAERNAQVALMGTIYRKARKVLVWLGVSRDGSDSVFENCSHDKIKDWTIEQWKCARLLLERSYWNRAWIVQEVVLARKLVLHCGTKTLTGEAFDDLVSHFDGSIKGSKQQRRKLYASFREPGERQDDDSRMHEWYWTEHPSVSLFNFRRGWVSTNMETLIRRFGVSAQCTDLHDKVYSLIGLAKDAELFVIDYAQEIEVLFFTAMRFYWGQDSLGFANTMLQALDLKPRLRSMQTESPWLNAARLPADRNEWGNHDIEIEYVGKLKLDSTAPQPEPGLSQGNMRSFIVPWTSNAAPPNAQKLCFTNGEARKGDRVYWFRHTHYVLIFRRVGPGVALKILGRSTPPKQQFVCRAVVFDTNDQVDAARRFHEKEFEFYSDLVPGAAFLDLKDLKTHISIGPGTLLKLLEEP